MHSSSSSYPSQNIPSHEVEGEFVPTPSSPDISIPLTMESHRQVSTPNPTQVSVLGQGGRSSSKQYIEDRVRDIAIRQSNLVLIGFHVGNSQSVEQFWSVRRTPGASGNSSQIYLKEIGWVEGYREIC